jgi:hypothetical protein
MVVERLTAARLRLRLSVSGLLRQASRKIRLVPTLDSMSRMIASSSMVSDGTRNALSSRALVETR